MNRLFRCALTGAVLSASFAGGVLLALSGNGSPVSSESHYQRLGPGGRTRPLLDCEAGEYENGPSLIPGIHQHIESIAGEAQQRRGLSRVAVYYRDLGNGPWVGFNEQELFTPASLFKVPAAIACLKEAERDPSFLGRSIRFDGLPGPLYDGYRFRPPETLEAGRTYTIEELIERAIVHSDNGAALLLYKAVSPRILDAVQRDVGIAPVSGGAESALTTAEKFSRYFRVLYNATYLSRSHSEKILSLLARSSFDAGLVAGLPRSTAVAHKYGEHRDLLKGRTVTQLHDCGIVYHPGRPYILCVMTTGWDMDAQAKAIADIARSVDEKITSDSAN